MKAETRNRRIVEITLEIHRLQEEKRALLAEALARAGKKAKR